MPFKFTDYIFTPQDLFRSVFHLFVNFSWKDIFVPAAFVLIFIFTRDYLGWQAGSSFLLIFSLFSFYSDRGSRISITLALLFLLAASLISVMGETVFLEGDVWADQAAHWTFYFLAIGAVKQIWDFKKRGSGQAEESEDEEIEESNEENEKEPVAENLEKEFKNEENDYVLDLRKFKNRKTP